MATAPLGHVCALHMVPLFLRPRVMVATAAPWLEKATGIWAFAASPVIMVTAPQQPVNIARYHLQYYIWAWYTKLVPIARKP